MRLLQIFIQKNPPSHPPAISKPEWPPKPDAFEAMGPPIIETPIDSFDILLFVASTLLAYYFLFHKKQPIKFK